MPIYEFRCASCGAVFEKMMKVSDPAPQCAECGHAEVQKLVSTSSFILKGGGWYKDHYGLKSSSGEAKSEKKAESKPAPKAD
jgi:putative FmdB family regulatory protein